MLMSNFLTSLVLASLLIPNGFNFIIEKSIDFPYSEVAARENMSPVRIINNSFGLETTSSSIVVFDDPSETILYSKNSGAVLPIASLTKLMTALVFLDTNPDWDSTVIITAEDLREGAITRLIPGEEIILRDLFNIMLVASVNEAAIALARVSGIEDFTSAMNNKANQLGMWKSFFVEPSGIDFLNVSRPADLIKLTDAAFASPDITEALSYTAYSFTAQNTGRIGTVKNTNKLLDSFLNDNLDYKIVGAKTGFLNEAGYCLLIKVQQVDGSTLTLVILGADSADSRWQESKGLVDWVFNNYLWPKPVVKIENFNI